MEGVKPIGRRWLAHPLWRLRRPGGLLLLVLGGGTAGYALLERWSLLDSFFMTVITVSTVGYQEVHPLNAVGKVFSAGLIISGVGIVLYALEISAAAYGDGQVARWRKERRLDRIAGSLRGHFIICGYGRMGTRVVAELERAQVPHIVVDNSPDAVSRLGHDQRVFVEGDAASEEVLRNAGVERAKGLICAVDSDERAVYITLAARSLNPKLYIIARAGWPESMRRLELAGADRVVSPYQMGGQRMAEMALRPGVVDVVDSLRAGSGDIIVEEFAVPAGWPRSGQTLAQAGLLGAGAARVLAVRRGATELVVGPLPDQPVREGDHLVVLGSMEEIDRSANLLR